MKIRSKFLAVISYWLCILSAAKTTFVAVSPLVGFENFYSKPWYEYHDDLSPKMKADICAHVTGSPFFDTLKVDPVNPTDNGVYTILKDNYPDIYAELYEERNSSAVFTNLYRKRKIVVEKRVLHKFMFSCLTFDRESGNITQYFVSKVYLLNTDHCRHHADQMKGVFIFMEKDNETRVIAVAEQPGYVVNPRDTPYDFELEISKSTYEEYEINRTICALTTQEKIRLCTLVLSTESLRKKVTFVPDKENVDDDCHRGVMQIHRLQKNESNNATKNESNNATKNDSDDATKNDWMVGCKATKVENAEPVTYYVSAGFESYEQIFFCKEPDSENLTMVGGIGCRIEVRKRLSHPVEETGDEK